MTARTTMATLITHLRLLINDANSTTQQFTDDELEDLLDNRCQKVDQVEMIPVETINATTLQLEYLAYRMLTPFWEGSPVLQDSDLATITPSASDLLRGRWTLSADTDPPCYITGTVYDIYGAAADALEALAAKRMLGYDDLASRFSRPRSQDIEAIHRQAERYRRQSWPNVLTVRG
jgi:hypothetical protein